MHQPYWSRSSVRLIFQWAGPGRIRHLWASSTGLPESPTRPSTPGKCSRRTAWRCTRTDAGMTTTACRREASYADTANVRVFDFAAILMACKGCISVFFSFWLSLLTTSLCEPLSQTIQQMTVGIQSFPLMVPQSVPLPSATAVSHYWHFVPFIAILAVLPAWLMYWHFILVPRWFDYSFGDILLSPYTRFCISLCRCRSDSWRHHCGRSDFRRDSRTAVLCLQSARL